MTDARFEDALISDSPVRLKAETAEDLPVISALVQDAVGKVAGIAWMPKRRRLALVLHRFRWEDREAAEAEGRPFERVQAAISVESVLSVRARGLDPQAPETVFAVLALSFEPGEDGAGRLVFRFAGDGDLAAEVECLDVTLADLTRPWAAPSGKAPAHGER